MIGFVLIMAGQLQAWQVIDSTDDAAPALSAPAQADECQLFPPSSDGNWLSRASALGLDAQLAAVQPTSWLTPTYGLAAPDDPSGSTEQKRLRSWELPPVTVVGSSPSLTEEQRVGGYGQPRWTATRRFPTTRVYVLPEGKIDVEGWMRTTFEKDGTTEIRALEEVELGLPYRFQLDLYARQDWDSESDETLWGGQFEVRWALADWGVIPGNPTFYFEYLALDDRPDKIEPKLLFGGEIAERWHWGFNIVAELELSGEEEHEYEFTGGLSYCVVDSKFSVGVETTFSMIDEKGDRGDFQTPLLIGPSFQWRPVEPMTINFSPLIGVGGDSPDVQLWLNIGWEF